MKGWYNESSRHALAARGIRTKSRALIKPSGRVDSRHIDHAHRTFRDIDELSSVLKNEKITNPINGIHGGITTSVEGGPNVETHGSIFLEFNVDELLEVNDLIKIDYESEFLISNRDIAKRIEPSLSKTKLSDSDVSTLIGYEDEQELVSRHPIKVPIRTIEKILVRYGGGVHDPITGEWKDYEEYEDDESWKRGREIISEIRKKIPRGYWHLIYLENTTADEIQKLDWLM